MKRLALIGFVLAVVTAHPVAQTQTTQRGVARPAPIQSMLDTYCISCHGSTVRAGGIGFTGMSLDAIAENADILGKSSAKTAWPSDASAG
jgi:hypothetical protein